MTVEAEPGPSGLSSRISNEIEVEEDDEMLEEKPSLIDMAPVEVLTKIFSYFDLPTRGHASMVCRRWRTLLLSSLCRMEDVVVLNVFERTVWDEHVKNNKGVRVKTIQMNDVDTLKNISHLISEANTVKFWYKNYSFAKKCIEKIADSKMELKTVDLYPYGSELVTDIVHEKLPNLTGVTMRPHEKSFFWTGLDMDSFPNFQKLETLCVDTINLSPNVILPSSLTALEFQNRNHLKHLDFLKLLAPLKNLESLSISHGDFTKRDDFYSFLDAIDGTVLPKLTFLTLKFCKFPEETIDWTSYSDPKRYSETFGGERRMFLKMIKVDLCYGPMDHIGSTFIQMNKDLAIFVLQIMSDDQALIEVANLAQSVLNRRAWLHLAVMQRDGIRRSSSVGPKDQKPMRVEFPEQFFRVLTKFECSFVDKHNLGLLNAIFHGPITACQDVKLINCPGITNEHLEGLAKTSKMLRRLSVISCDRVDEDGILPFFFKFDDRRSIKLEIVWKRRSHCARPANLYLEIAHKHREMIFGKKLVFSTKTFSDDCDGERVTLYDKTSRKKLYIQDFSEPDVYRIIGVVVGKPMDIPPEEAPPPIPEDIEEQKTRLAKLLKKSSV